MSHIASLVRNYLGVVTPVFSRFIVHTCVCTLQLLNFRLVFLNGDQTVYAIPSVMSSVYFSGSFKIDFLSTFPFDRVFVATVGMGMSLASLRLLRFVRLFRLLKLFRFLKFRQYMRKMQMAVVASPYVVEASSLTCTTLCCSLGIRLLWGSIPSLCPN